MEGPAEQFSESRTGCTALPLGHVKGTEEPVTDAACVLSSTDRAISVRRAPGRGDEPMLTSAVFATQVPCDEISCLEVLPRAAALGSRGKQASFSPRVWQSKAPRGPAQRAHQFSACCHRVHWVFVSALKKYGSVRNRICFTEDGFGESCPQKQKKHKSVSPEGIWL